VERIRVIDDPFQKERTRKLTNLRLMLSTPIVVVKQRNQEILQSLPKQCKARKLASKTKNVVPP
jgi:hypothetical protein